MAKVINQGLNFKPPAGTVARELIVFISIPEAQKSGDFETVVVVVPQTAGEIFRIYKIPWSPTE